LAVIYHKAGLNKAYEVQDLEELLDAAYNEEGDLAERIGEMIKEIKAVWIDFKAGIRNILFLLTPPSPDERGGA